jgi:hypothetical protein
MAADRSNETPPKRKYNRNTESIAIIHGDGS